jgi:hypothetical protein
MRCDVVLLVGLHMAISSAQDHSPTRSSLIRTYKQLELIAKLSHDNVKARKYALMEATLESHEMPLKQIENDPRGAEQEYERDQGSAFPRVGHKVDAGIIRHIAQEESRHMSRNPYRHKHTYSEQAEPLYQIGIFFLLGAIINYKWRNGTVPSFTASSHHSRSLFPANFQDCNWCIRCGSVTTRALPRWT